MQLPLKVDWHMQLRGPSAELLSALQQFSAPEADRARTANNLWRCIRQISLPELQHLCHTWLAGEIGPIDPTNMLVAGDFADTETLGLQQHAVAFYDTALEFMVRHPKSIAADTDCAAASLNLLGILEDAEDHDRMRVVSLRAMRMPILGDDQRVRLSYALNQVGEAAHANSLFVEGMRTDPAGTAKKLGVPLDEVLKLGRSIAARTNTTKSTAKRPDPSSQAIGLYNLAIKHIESGDRSQAAAVFDMALNVAQEETFEERGLKAMIAYYAGVNLLRKAEEQMPRHSIAAFNAREEATKKAIGALWTRSIRLYRSIPKQELARVNSEFPKLPEIIEKIVTEPFMARYL